MKFFVLTLLLLLGNFIYSQTYPIPASEARWGMVQAWGPPDLPGAGKTGYYFTFNGKDTIINNILYQAWSKTRFTRYDGDILYIIDSLCSTTNEIVELKYYDFNLEVNDTFLLPEIDFGNEIIATVTDVSTMIDIAGKIRKVVELETPDHIKLKWVEGLGDVYYGLFYMNGIYSASDMGSWLVCYSDSSGNVYKQEGFDFPCDSLDYYYVQFNAVEEVLICKDEIKVFPNPFTNYINIETEENSVMIRISNLKGQELIMSHQKQIQCGGLKNGLYFLEVIFDDKTNKTFIINKID